MKFYLNLPRRVKTALFCSAAVFIFILTAGLLWPDEENNTIASPSWTKAQLAQLLGPHLQVNERPSTLSRNVGGADESLQLDYTIDPDMQDYTDRLMKRFRPDYAALVAVDATTGEILTMSSYEHENSHRNLSLTSSFPAASVFKLVTAAAALDMAKVRPDSTIVFTGRSHTLYRRDVIGNPSHRWTKLMSITDAFAQSANTLFGKLGLYYVGGNHLQEYADRFGFNRSIFADFPLPPSLMKLDDKDDWVVVEAASGFNNLTTLSPVHGALLAAAVANDGVMMEPYLVRQVSDVKGDILYKAHPTVSSHPISLRANNDLRVLMEATILRGTSRRAFRKLTRHKLYSEARFGGKTGSLTGTDPVGKTDWFVGYMEYKGRRIALASVSVHGKIWRIRSSQIASSYFEQFLYRAITDKSQVAKR